MLLHMKRGLTAALILTLTLTLGVPALAADPLAGGGFAQVAISAKNSDSPTLDLDLAIWTLLPPRAARIAAEEAAKKAAEEEAARKAAEEEAARKAAEEEAARKAAEEEAAREAAANDVPQEPMVWIPVSGSKYHRNPDGSNMNGPTQVPLSTAQARGYEPCKRCY